MKNEFFKLLQIKNRFQPQIENSNLYTYIAPKERKKYDLFIDLVAIQPTGTLSYYEILSNDNNVKMLLNQLGLLNIELEIYIALNDIQTAFGRIGTLRDYIKAENLNFEY